MRILHRYIFRTLLGTFLTALVVLSFVMMVGLLFKATGYIASGASFSMVARFLWLGFPGTLSMSIPIAALVSTLLVFGRLSSDSEISAMRACGVSMRRIMLTPFLLGIALSVASLYITAVVSPNSAYGRRTIRRIVKASDFLAVIQPGKTVTGIPGMPPGTSVFVRSRGKKPGKNEQGMTEMQDVLEDVRILEPMKRGGMRDIRAGEARVFQNTNGTVRLEMSNVTISPLHEDRPITGQAEWISYTVGEERDIESAPSRRVKDMPSHDLLQAIAATNAAIAQVSQNIGDNRQRIRNVQEEGLAERTRFAENLALLASGLAPSTNEVAASWSAASDLATRRWDYELREVAMKSDLRELQRTASKMRTEYSNRIVLALASLCFIAVAVPYGLKINRRESSMGTFLCLGVCVFYNLILIMTDSLAKNPGCRPHLIAWIPVVVCLLLSIHGIRRNT